MIGLRKYLAMQAGIRNPDSEWWHRDAPYIGTAADVPWRACWQSGVDGDHVIAFDTHVSKWSINPLRNRWRAVRAFVEAGWGPAYAVTLANGLLYRLMEYDRQSDIVAAARTLAILSRYVFNPVRVCIEDVERWFPVDSEDMFKSVTQILQEAHDESVA